MTVAFWTLLRAALAICPGLYLRLWLTRYLGHITFVIRECDDDHRNDAPTRAMLNHLLTWCEDHVEQLIKIHTCRHLGIRFIITRDLPRPR